MSGFVARVSAAAGRWATTSFHGLGRIYTDLLFPPRCVACSTELPQEHDGVMACARCRQALAPEARPRCPRCAAVTAAKVDPALGCLRCRGSGLRFDAADVLGDYDGLLREAVLRMKRWWDEPVSLAIGELFARRLQDRVVAWDVDVVVPVPMHWWRRLVQGTNSPDLLAAAVARQLGKPLAVGALVRRRLTRPQSRLPPSSRAQNVRGAFRVQRGCDFSQLRVLVVDDILTTGATCSEMAKVLKQAGAAAVYAAVVARAAAKP